MDVKQNENRNRRGGLNPRARGRGRGAGARDGGVPAAAAAAAGGGARGGGRGRGRARARGRAAANGGRGGRGGRGGGHNGGAAGMSEAAARDKIDNLVNALMRTKRDTAAAAREVARQQLRAGLVDEWEYAQRIRQIEQTAWAAFDTKRYNRGGESAEYSPDRQLVTVVLPRLSGVFRCAQCHAFWVSAQTAVDFRGAAAASVHPPRCVKLWHQQCKQCRRDEWPEFDVKIGGEDRWQWLTERVTRMLDIMACVPVAVADVQHDDGRADPEKPHLSALCERCKAGKFCTEAGGAAGAK